MAPPTEPPPDVAAAAAASREDAAPAAPRETVGRLTLRFSGGFGGQYEATARVVALDGSESVREPEGELLQPSLGGHVQFEVPVLGPWLSLGFLAGVVTWTTGAGDAELERASWLDLDVTARSTLELADGLVELYLLVPAGLTVNRFSEPEQASSEVPWGHGPGVNVGVLAGVGFDLGGHGLFIDVGWTHRQFFHDSAGTTFGTPVTFALDGVTNQVHLGAGLFFDL